MEEELRNERAAIHLIRFGRCHAMPPPSKRRKYEKDFSLLL
jgi:hypothetical protein